MSNASPHVESKPAHTPGNTFTPGPWLVENGSHVYANDPKRVEIAWDVQNEGNAALIASSPTMYAYIARKAQEGDADAQAIISTL